MKEPTAFCKHYNGPSLKSEDLKVGSLVAAKYAEDGQWYR